MSDTILNLLTGQFIRFFPRIFFVFATTVIAGITYPALANQCIPGFVWREASPSDLVCVYPAQRDQAADDNAAAASRIAPCRPGFVHRRAVRGDRVCVTPAARDLATSENNLSLNRTNLLCTQVAEDPALCPKSCKEGFVYRQATDSDFICAPPQAHSRVLQENTAGPQNKGVNTCIDGYVWRGAFEGDAVCVKPEVRKQVLEDNASARGRMVSPSPAPPPPPPPPSSPAISVNLEQAQFVVTGLGFRPSVKAFIIVVYPDDLSRRVFEDTADSSGRLNFKKDVSSLCISGQNLTLNFTVNQADASGNDKFTNTVAKSCPS